MYQKTYYHRYHRHHFHLFTGIVTIALALIRLVLIKYQIKSFPFNAGYVSNNSHQASKPTNNSSNAIQIATNNIMQPFGTISWKLITYLILIVMIASTGYGLSSADMHSVYSGLLY